MGSKTTHITLFFSIVSDGTQYPVAKPIKVDFIIVVFVHIQLAPFSEKKCNYEMIGHYILSKNILTVG